MSEPRRKWAEIVAERDAYIVARYKEGATRADIAEDVGVCVTIVSHACIVALGKGYVANEKKAAVQAAYSPDKTVKQIAEASGLNIGNTYMVLKTLGLKASRGVTGIRARPDWPEHQASAQKKLCEMVAMREAGKSLQEIGDAYGLTRERARQLVGHIEIGTEERVCIVCDETFEASKITKTVYCGQTCRVRVALNGLDRAREMAVEARDREAHKQAGEIKCYRCHQWLPASEFTPGSQTKCRKCNAENARKYRPRTGAYNEERRQSCAQGQQRRRERERQEAAV